MNNNNNNNNNNSNNNKPLLNCGVIIKNRWQIQNKLGSGSFGEIYSAVDISGDAKYPRHVAIKVEKCDKRKQVLKLELTAMKHLQSCDRVVRYVHSGRFQDVNFLVMEKLGENLAQLRKEYGKRSRFTMSTTIRLGIQMLECIEGIHKLGFVHRDVKPANFVTNLDCGELPGPVRIYIIDFGLARKYILANGEIRPPRSSAGFRGTVRYASINSHEMRELGPHDDLWSLFYSLVEFATGALPWMNMRDKTQVLAVKKRFTNETLVDGLPHEFLLFMRHLQALKYGDMPDYTYLKGLLTKVCEVNGYAMDDLYDWQQKSIHAGSRDPENRSSSKSVTMNVSGTIPSSAPQDGNFYNIVRQPGNSNINVQSNAPIRTNEPNKASTNLQANNLPMNENSMRNRDDGISKLNQKANTGKEPLRRKKRPKCIVM
jgi:tau tubulin kinase